MFNNFTNINKTNNHLPPHIMEQELNTTTYGIGNPGPRLRQAQKRGVVKTVNWM